MGKDEGNRQIATTSSAATLARRPRFKWARRARLAGAATLTALSAIGCSPAGLLNGASRLAPGGDSGRKAADGVAFGADPRQKLDVWVPQKGGKAAAAKRPVVIFFYGGAWNSGARGDYGFAGRAFAARDFVTIVPDYRLYPEVSFPGFVEDAALAVKWARDHAADYGGDPDRIALVGHSAGAHLAALVALDPHYLADLDMPADTIKAAALLSGPYDFLPFTNGAARDALGQWPRPLETQPVHFARKAAPPMLLISGTADTTVRARNSQLLARALADAGSEAELKLYKGEGHTDTIKAISPLFRDSNPALRDSVDFLRQHLK